VEVKGLVVLEDSDVGVRADGGREGSLDLSSCCVSSVDDASMGMTPLTSKVKGPVRIGRKCRPPSHEVEDPTGALRTYRFYGSHVVQKGTCLECIAYVALRAVVSI
jgi:hypothetical protein